MEGQGTVLLASNFWLYFTGAVGILLILALGVLFFVSRKSQRVMQSMLDIMLRPESANVSDAVRVLNKIMADEITKIEHNFKIMCDTLNGQIAQANELKNQLTDQNEKLLSTADDATKKLVQMSGRLDNTLDGLNAVVSSKSWEDTTTASEKFSASVNELLSKIDKTNQDTTTAVSQIQQIPCNNH